MLKVGLIGCGGIGAVHAECWLTLSDSVCITAVADSDEERARKYAEKSGARVYRDGMELLEKEELDVVDICVPTFLHASYTLKAMEKVKNILVEKPICLKEEEALELLKKQEETGARIQVGHVVRFTDAYRYLKETADSGKYGKIVAGSFSRISPRPEWMSGYDDMERTGTMLLDMHIHDADYIRYLMGKEPESLDSHGVRDKYGIVQHVYTAYQFQNVILAAEASWDYPGGFPFTATYRVKFERAAITLESNGTVAVYLEGGDKFLPNLGTKMEMSMGINVSDMRPYYNEIHFFINNILTNSNHEVATLRDSIASFRLVKKEQELMEIYK